MIQRWLPRVNQIQQIETAAVFLLLHHFGSELMHKKVIGMVDSESSLGAIIKGYSFKEDITELVSLIWERASDNSIMLFLDRVSSDANVSDQPSMDVWEHSRSCEWEELEVEIPDCIRGDINY